MLITHYHHLIEREGCGFREAMARGSMERLSQILMTALEPGVGLIPLVGKGEPGKEIQQPLAVVILGSIFTSTFLNMIVIPALYLKFAGIGERVRVEEPSMQDNESPKHKGRHRDARKLLK
ncbi:MAG: efflux RND transporter permease subunit [Blastocatellia bacterium]